MLSKKNNKFSSLTVTCMLSCEKNVKAFLPKLHVGTSTGIKQQFLDMLKGIVHKIYLFLSLIIIKESKKVFNSSCTSVLAAQDYQAVMQFLLPS